MSNLLMGDHLIRNQVRKDSEKSKLAARAPNWGKQETHQASGAIKILRSSIIDEGPGQIHPYRIYKGWMALFGKCLTNKKITKREVIASTSPQIVKRNPLIASFSNSKLKATFEPTQAQQQAFKHCCEAEIAGAIKNRTKRIHTPFTKECVERAKRRRTTFKKQNECAIKDSPYTNIIARYINNDSILNSSIRPQRTIFRNGLRKKHTVSHISRTPESNQIIESYLTEIPDTQLADSTTSRSKEQSPEYLRQLTY